MQVKPFILSKSRVDTLEMAGYERGKNKQIGFRLKIADLIANPFVIGQIVLIKFFNIL